MVTPGSHTRHLRRSGARSPSPCNPLNHRRFADDSMDLVILARALLSMNRIEHVPRWTALETFRGMS